MIHITQELVRELLHYDPATGVFTWHERGERWFKTERDCSAWNTRYAGKRAGGFRMARYGYRRREICLFGNYHKEHRIAWLWVIGLPVPVQIDHINQDASDNRWSNLRASTHGDNMRNRPRQRNNTSGVTGVYWNQARGKWQAQCKVNGKNNNLGLFSNADEAAEVVARFRADHGFDIKHGNTRMHAAQPGTKWW